MPIVESYSSTVKQLESWCGVKWLNYLLHKLQVGRPRKYITRLLSLQIPNSGKRIPRLCIITSFYLDKYQFQLSAHDINTVWYTGNAHFLLLMRISMNIDHCFSQNGGALRSFWQLLRAGTRICLSSKIYKLAKKKYDGTCRIISFRDLGWFR